MSYNDGSCNHLDFCSQDYLVNHDRTAGSLGFKEVFLVPKKVQNQIQTKEIKTFLLHQPEEAHKLSTEDRVVTLP